LSQNRASEVRNENGRGNAAFAKSKLNPRAAAAYARARTGAHIDSKPSVSRSAGSWVFSLDFSMCASRKISTPAFVSSNRAPPRLPSRGRYVGHRLRLYGWRFTTRNNLPAIGQARTPLIFQRAIVLAIPLHWRQGVDVSLSFRPVKRNLRHVDDGFLTS
jgi:hypothetical protein